MIDPRVRDLTRAAWEAWKRAIDDRRAAEDAFEAQALADVVNLVPPGKVRAKIEAITDKYRKQAAIERATGPVTWREFWDTRQVQARELAARHDATVDARRKAFVTLATVAPLEPGDWRRYGDRCASTYSTQGYGAETYARNAAAMLLSHVQAHGVEGRIAEGPEYEKKGLRCTVEVRLADELDVEILRERPEPTLRDLVKACWKRGANPRVHWPMLPHGFEAANGLDYFGSDVPGWKPPAKGTP